MIEEKNEWASISWEEAISLIESGSIVQVGQTHSLIVRLWADDGRKYVTKEPELDAVIRVIQTLDPELRERIAIRTE